MAVWSEPWGYSPILSGWCNNWGRTVLASFVTMRRLVCRCCRRTKVYLETVALMRKRICMVRQIAGYECAYDGWECANAWKNWFKLYRRLSWYGRKELVKKLLGAIKTCVAIPWLEPLRRFVQAAQSRQRQVKKTSG